MNSPLLKFYGLYSEKENQETPTRWPAGRICRLIELCACPHQLHLCVRVRALNVQLCANEHKPSVLLPCPTGISIQPRPRQTIRGGKTWINLPLLVFIQRSWPATGVFPLVRNISEVNWLCCWKRKRHEKSQNQLTFREKAENNGLWLSLLTLRLPNKK